MRVPPTKFFTPFLRRWGVNFSISAKAKNLFLSLAESKGQTLNVTSCYVCGGTNMGDHWPWKARELDPWEPFNETALPKHREDIWLLKTFTIKNYWISHPKGQFSTLVGDLTCLQWHCLRDPMVGSSQHTKPQLYPLANFSNIQRAWNNLTTNIDWQAPRGLYWICGKQADTVLPSSWFGSCVLDSIRQSFFLLPHRQGKKLGVSIYKKRLSTQKWVAVQIGN
jgi:hypothetical protein